MVSCVALAVSCQPAAVMESRIQQRRRPSELQAVFVDATGRASALARAQRVKRLSYDRLVGMVASFSDPGSAQDEDGRTLVEAVESGWWYSARLPDSRIVVAYMTDTDLLRKAKGQLLTHFRHLLKTSGVRVIRTRFRAPNCNAYAERFLRSIKEECLDRLIPLGERHVRRTLAECVVHYHRERNIKASATK
jgi:hypothetical protein